ncbi:MAG: AAA family ATPase [Candidatus Gastranaerophilales bacterium]|nr:AAA family ATPase [Candidatus Gastranaerophilales bacterium]
MICPKCKQQIPEKTLKCNFCQARVATLCKSCHAYNSIYNLNCVNCNAQLLKVCPSCKSINLPNALKCRKCGIEFEETGEEAKQPSLEIKDFGPSAGEGQYASKNTSSHSSPLTSHSNDIELLSQQKANEALVEGILSSDKRVISLSGKKGVGKSIVIKSAINHLHQQGIIWLFGECSAITQLSPCGLIQDILLTFFNIPNFCLDSLKLKKESQKFFQTEFPTLTNEEIFNLLNFLYPTNVDYFENIIQNKEKTFTLLNKVFKTIIKHNKTVFVLENFDLIDGLSYEFLYNLLNSDISAKSLKFLLTYEETRPARGYLYSEKLENSAYFDISINTFDKAQTNSFINQYFLNEKCPEDIKEQIGQVCGGNAAVLEQFVSLLIDFKTRNNSFYMEIPETFNEAVNMRLNFLLENPVAYKVLCIAAIQGMKFNHSIINQVLTLDEGAFVEILTLLQNLNFIMRVSEHSFAFKNSMLWTTIFSIIKEDENFVDLNTGLFSIYSNYTLSTNSIMAVIAQNLNQNLSALNFWTENTKLTSYIGDTNLYAISQKQCLVLIDALDNTDNFLIKNNIYERLGKLLSKSNPQEAIEYLPNAIANAKKIENTLKEIELAGYLADCCISLGDYYGTIECIDAVTGKLDYNLDLEVAMLKSRKLRPLLNIGNSGEIINLVDNEIMPVFDKYINAKPHKNITIKSLYEAWLQSYLALANALVFQGNNRSFDVISTLFELFEKNAFDNKLFICKTKLTLAFANTIKGDIETSEKILEEIIKVYKTDIMDNEAISRWNLINILNNFMHKKYSGIKEELFQVVTFANNINDHFTKNILKTMLGKLFKDDENAKKALDIYSEQITYFAKEKNAIGALLTWYFIAEAKLVAEGPEKSLEVSQKALDVAQGSKINSYLFVVLFNKVIAEAYMAQSEYELAKVHIEKGILVARKFEMLNSMADLYLLYGKYLQDIALIKTDAQYDYVLGAAKMYKKAGLISQGIKNVYLSAKIDKAKTVLNSFCQLNGIILKDV